MAPSRRAKRPLNTATPTPVQSQNPFQQRWARSKATAARKQLLSSQTKNTIIDKRIAEHDPTISDADRYLLRLQRERSKMNKKAARFNLNDRDDYDDNNVTPNQLGNILSGGLREGSDAGIDRTQRFAEDYNQDGDNSDNDDKGELFTLKTNEDNEGDGNGEGENEQEDEDIPRTKREIMHEVMQKSKEYKAQRQQDKYHADEQTADLDTDLPQIMQLLQQSQSDQRQVSEEQSSLLVTTAENRSVTITTANDDKQKSKSQNDFQYESVYQMLAAEKRARPTDRLLTEEQAAEKERDRLVEMENLRQRRMQEIDDGGMNMNEKPMKGRLRDRSGADDLVDSFQRDGDDDDDDDDGVDTEMQEDSDEENERANGSENEHKDKTENGEEHASVGSVPLFWKSFKIEEVVAQTEEEVKEINTKEIPYVYSKCPTTADELQILFKDTTVDQRGIIVERLRTCFAISLDSGRNRRRLQRLLECLLCRIELLAGICGEFLGRAVKEIDVLLIHVHGLGSTFENTVSGWARSEVSECAYLLFKSSTNGGNSEVANYLYNEEAVIPVGLTQVWSSRHVLVLRAVARLFPSSDMRHSVVTPLAMMLSEALNPWRMVSVADVGLGLFVAYVLMEATGGRSGYSPDLAEFISKIVLSCYAIDPEEWIAETDLRPIFSGLEIGEGDMVGTFKLSECEILSSGDESITKITATKILNSVLSLMEVWFKDWTPNADIVLADINLSKIVSDSVRIRVETIIHSSRVDSNGKERKPLTLYTKKERTVVKVLNPRMHCEENGVYHKRGRSRFGGPGSVEEAATAAKRVRKALRKAERGQVRDIRTDAAAIAHERLTDESMKREKANNKDKEVRAFLEHQRSTWRAAEKKQNKLAGKRW